MPGTQSCGLGIALPGMWDWPHSREAQICVGTVRRRDGAGPDGSRGVQSAGLCPAGAVRALSACAPPFHWWQRPTSTVHRSAASKPRDAGREAAPGAAPHPPHRGLGSPDAPRRPHVRKGSLFPLSTFWSVPRAAETWRPLQFLGQCSAHNVSRASKGEARAWPAPTPGAAGPGCARLRGSRGCRRGAWAMLRARVGPADLPRCRAGRLSRPAPSPLQTPLLPGSAGPRKPCLVHRPGGRQQFRPQGSCFGLKSILSKFGVGTFKMLFFFTQ